ncbi:hypothetical protein EYF80_003592 [Liparis tanakae]|uniref:Uncharacterized protein n=1 Tax=Liparis tanakae TaxID=230148 RepID=A0A4Z2J734_9TELE|nr:hypothetical protein EYF80_003592 [Liparis tanakae]
MGADSKVRQTLLSAPDRTGVKKCDCAALYDNTTLVQSSAANQDSQTMTSSSRETDVMYDAGPVNIGYARTLYTTQQPQDKPVSRLHV